MTDDDKGNYLVAACGSYEKIKKKVLTNAFKSDKM